MLDHDVGTVGIVCVSVHMYMRLGSRALPSYNVTTFTCARYGGTYFGINIILHRLAERPTVNLYLPYPQSVKNVMLQKFCFK
jgi:hypothetical protein